jgi:putative ABC transport system permease protein
VFAEYFRIAFRNLRSRGTRSFLTVLGIFIGIAAVVSLVSMGTGLKNFMDDAYSKVGYDKIMILPGVGGTMGAGGISIEPFTSKDVKIIERVRGVDMVMPLIMSLVTIEHAGQERKGFIGVIPNHLTDDVVGKMFGYYVTHGRPLRTSDRDAIVIGTEFVGDMYDKPVRMHSKLTVRGHEFKVVGLLEAIGAVQKDSTIYVPWDKGKEVLGVGDEVSMIYATAKNGFDVEKVAADIREELEDSRGKEDFAVNTLATMSAMVMSAMLAVQGLIIGMAAISLVVGGIGIMNTMYTSVLERTQEIGILKAVGARNGDIMMIFLIESGMLGTVGGVLGCMVGVGLGLLMGIGARAGGISAMQPDLGVHLWIGSIAFSFIVGSASGLLPAMQAANLHPVDALRYE